VVDILEAKLGSRKLYDFEKLGSRAVRLLPGSAYLLDGTVIDRENTNSALELYFQTCHYDELRSRCLTQLVAQCISDRFFAQLRTQQQLGYSVASGLRLLRGSCGLRFIIQSLYSPEYLELCIERYLFSERTYFQEMELQEFAKHVDSLVLRKLEKHKNLRQETDAFWESILSGSYDFDYGL